MVTDQGLESLFELLPPKCIVLIEDIDTAQIKRHRDPEYLVELDEKSDTTDKDGKRRKTKRPSSLVTLGGLLNVLDGPCSKFGRLVFLTSNTPHTLDAALLRPGRIDGKVLFGYTTPEVSSLLFEHIFTKSAEEIEDEKEASDQTQAADQVPAADQAPATFENADISAMGKDFAAQITLERITPAEIQGYLMKNRDDPHAAVRGVADWARNMVEVKDRGANVEAFENEIRGSDSEVDLVRHRDSPVRASAPARKRRGRGRILEEDVDVDEVRHDDLPRRTSGSTRKRRGRGRILDEDVDEVRHGELPVRASASTRERREAEVAPEEDLDAGYRDEDHEDEDLPVRASASPFNGLPEEMTPKEVLEAEFWPGDYPIRLRRR